jgi:hypothetical protein
MLPKAEWCVELAELLEQMEQAARYAATNLYDPPRFG